MNIHGRMIHHGQIKKKLIKKDIMADKLYTGAITELIDWANGTEFNETNLDSKTTQEFLEAYEDGEYDGISGASIRNLL